MLPGPGNPRRGEESLFCEPHLHLMNAHITAHSWCSLRNNPRFSEFPQLKCNRNGQSRPEGKGKKPQNLNCLTTTGNYLNTAFLKPTRPDLLRTLWRDSSSTKQLEKIISKSVSGERRKYLAFSEQWEIINQVTVAKIKLDPVCWTSQKDTTLKCGTVYKEQKRRGHPNPCRLLISSLAISALHW